MDRVQWAVFSAVISIIVAAYLGIVFKQFGATIGTALSVVAL